MRHSLSADTFSQTSRSVLLFAAHKKMDYSHQQLLNEWIQKHHCERPEYKYETHANGSFVEFRCSATFLGRSFATAPTAWYKRKDEAKRALDLVLWEHARTQGAHPQPVSASGVPQQRTEKESTAPCVRVLYVDFDTNVVDSYDTLQMLSQYYNIIQCVVSRRSPLHSTAREWVAKANQPDAFQLAVVEDAAATLHWINRRIGNTEAAARADIQFAHTAREVGILSKNSSAFIIQDLYNNESANTSSPLRVTAYNTSYEVFDSRASEYIIRSR